MDWCVFKKLADSLPEERKNITYNCLPPSVESNWRDLKPTTNNNSLTHTSLLQEKIHPLWFSSTVNQLSSKERSILLFPLPNLASYYHVNTVDANIPDQVLTMALYNMTFDKYPIPYRYLPEHPLELLIPATYQEIVLLCQFLGLFDLHVELSKIINTRVIKKIKSALDSEEIKFLTTISKYKPKTYLQSMATKNIENVDLFRSNIFDMGLNRMARAFGNSDESILWYLIHTLTPKEANKFQLFNVKKSEEDAVNQVLSTWQVICTLSH